ncbi:MAG: PilZ domain-containing protein [Nitrospirae bacterium]|nr:PilZ domain-containing protein [Nitrospirota bacterium]
MQRIFDRVSSDLKIRFFCCNTVHSGTVKNISENGMFFTTQKMCSPFDSQVEIFISLGKDILHASAKLKRISKAEDSSDGVAVEVMNPPQGYIDFVKDLKSALK